MARTNIDIDDNLIAEVMARYNLRTKREAVDFALRQVQRRPLSREEILALRGIGWEGNLESIKRSRVADWTGDRQS